VQCAALICNAFVQQGGCSLPQVAGTSPTMGEEKELSGSKEQMLALVVGFDKFDK